MRDGFEPAVEASLTRLIDTALATRSRYPDVPQVSALGSPILTLNFRQKIRAFWFLTFRPLYQKAGPRQEPLGRSHAGERAKAGAHGCGAFRALAGGSNSKNFGLRAARQETG